MTKSGNIYTGVCIDTASTLGICAERNAISDKDELKKPSVGFDTKVMHHHTLPD